MTHYLTRRRARFKGLSGPVDIPGGTALEGDEALIFYKGKPLCAVTSQNAHKYFSINDDGQGIQRGQMVQKIMSKLGRLDEMYQERWDRIWDDKLCAKYRRKDYDDFWLWNHEFYNAPICDLYYIAGLIGAR